jgi:hypothetical protein
LNECKEKSNEPTKPASRAPAKPRRPIQREPSNLHTPSEDQSSTTHEDLQLTNMATKYRSDEDFSPLQTPTFATIPLASNSNELRLMTVYGMQVLQRTRIRRLAPSTLPYRPVRLQHRTRTQCGVDPWISHHFGGLSRSTDKRFDLDMEQRLHCKSYTFCYTQWVGKH